MTAERGLGEKDSRRARDEKWIGQKVRSEQCREIRYFSGQFRSSLLLAKLSLC